MNSKESALEQVLAQIAQDDDVENLRAMATMGVIAREVAVSSIHSAHQSMLSKASPEELPVVERYYAEQKAQLMMANLELVARMMEQRGTA